MVSTPPPPATDENPQPRGNYRLMSGVFSLDKSLQVLEQALGSPPEIPEPIMSRTRLRSDAMRMMSSTREEDVTEAEALFSEAINLELEDPISFNPNLTEDESAAQAVVRLRELRMMRANTRGSQKLQDYEGSIADFDAIIADEPNFTRAFMEKGKILRRWRKPQEALDVFKECHALGTTLEPPPKGFGMHKYMLTWLERIIEELEERLLEEEAIGSGEFGSADAGDDSMLDSGDGSGRWKVETITGLAWDTCIYHLVNKPPAEPHPYPNDAWHVNVRFGGTVREYTPVSSAADWEQGRIDLLVKTYEDGAVSKKFAMLRQASPYTAAEEQPCWALTSAPALTLTLPALTEQSLDVLSMMNPDHVALTLPPLEHLGLVVGGTGIAPAVQILREVLNPDGAFGPSTRATLLYSSRKPEDVLCIDTLRDVEAQSEGRIKVQHTLTDFEKPEGEEDATSTSTDYWLPGRHYHFTSQWNPYKPDSGELRTTEGEEAALRGRVDQKMLSAVLPPPADGTRIVVCGPPQMWEDMERALLAEGHGPNALVELKALSDTQVQEREATAAAGGAEGGQIEGQGALVAPSASGEVAAAGGEGGGGGGIVGLIRRWIGRPWQAKL